jgi:hypothetical protein
MFTQQEKVSIFRFYESWLNRLCNDGRESEDLSFSSQSCLGYLAVGGIEGKVVKINEDGRFSAINGVSQIQLKKLLPGSVPQSVLDFFDRHIWYARYNLSTVSVFKLNVNGIDTFTVCIEGYVDDGWDNSCLLLEIYDVLGNLIMSMGGTSLPWEDRLLDHKDSGYPLTPPYNQPNGRHGWSEEDIALV